MRPAHGCLIVPKRAGAQGSGSALRVSGRAGRTSDKRGSGAPPRTTAVRNECRILHDGCQNFSSPAGHPAFFLRRTQFSAGATSIDEFATPISRAISRAFVPPESHPCDVGSGRMRPPSSGGDRSFLPRSGGASSVRRASPEPGKGLGQHGLGNSEKRPTCGSNVRRGFWFFQPPLQEPLGDHLVEKA
ncbi:hypothetical protein V1290_005973 [Bradyrhizobium sp. AZCC 1578]